MYQLGGLFIAVGFAGSIMFSLYAMDRIDYLEEEVYTLSSEKKNLTVELREAQVDRIVLEQRLQDQLLINQD